MSLRIHKLNTGWIEATLGNFFMAEGKHPRVPGGQLRPHTGVQPEGTPEETSMIPNAAWYIEGAECRILVDTGLPSLEESRWVFSQYAGLGAADPVIEESHDLVAQLAAIGVSPSDIDVVILTHLHWDHIGQNELFENARFLVHKEELAWALCTPPFAFYYYKESRSHILNVLDRIEFVGDDHVAAPGVRVSLTGGHSPGHCAVFVETDIGTVVLTGDACHSYRTLEYNWPSGIYVDVDGASAAIQKLKTADVIVVHHDVLVDELFPGGVIGEAPLSTETADYMARLRTPGCFPLTSYVA